MPDQAPAGFTVQTAPFLKIDRNKGQVKAMTQAYDFRTALVNFRTNRDFWQKIDMRYETDRHKLYGKNVPAASWF